jgi:aminoglycoside 3-N-acetyltransferase
MKTINQRDYNGTFELLRRKECSMACVHSDIVFGFAFERGTPAKELMNAHYEVLKELMEGRDIWMPAFCYDFTGSREYDVQQSPSQVGMLTEYFRTDVARWRSPVPVFSFCGDGKKPEFREETLIDPFDEHSLFQAMIDRDALIIYYGVLGIYSSTIIHYCERLSGKLCYRYDKLFNGVIRDDNRQYAVTLKFHVRPKARYLDYDWKRLEADLVEDGLLDVINERRFQFRCIKACELAEYWLEKIAEDPLYLLDTASREWVEPELQRLGRPFTITDFES